MKKVILLIGLLLFTINNLYGIEPDGNRALKSSTKEEYELQERCSKRAEELFRKEFSNETVSNYYTNHYNRKLNKCFILVTETSIHRDKETREKLGVSSTYKTLLDINENKLYGSFWKLSKGVLMDCEVLGKHCNSENEWDSLVKPYMEE